MLASKYAESESAKPSETPKSPTSPKSTKKATPTKALPPVPSKAEPEEKYSWADEPMDPPPQKPKRKEPQQSADSHQATPVSEKVHGRKKSTVQAPTASAQDAPKPPLLAESAHSRTKSTVKPLVAETVQSTPQSETKHARKRSNVPATPDADTAQSTPKSEPGHIRKKSSVQLPQTTPPSVSGSNTSPASTTKKKKLAVVEEGPLIDLGESSGQPSAPAPPPRKTKKSQESTVTAAQPAALAPPKPDPTQSKPSTPDLVRRTSTPASGTLTPAKKVMSKRGRPCVIRIPKEEEDFDRRRRPWALSRYHSRFQELQREGFNVQGYDYGFDKHPAGIGDDGSTQNCAVYPDPTHQAQEKAASQKQGNCNVMIPDKRKWDGYMQQMMENKLKALGVKPAGEETPSAAEAMSRQASASFPGLANSPPPLSSSVNSQHHKPFSARSFSPAAFTNNTSVGALGSPASVGTQGRPGHMSRQSTFGFPFPGHGFNPAAQGNGNQQHQQHSLQAGNPNAGPPPQMGMPFPPGLQRMSSAQSRGSPDMFRVDRSQTQTPRMQSGQFVSNAPPGFSRHGTLPLEHTPVLAEDMSVPQTRQRRDLSTPPPTYRAQQQTYGELAYPTPHGHRHNISENLEREAENAQYYPGEYVNADRPASTTPTQTHSVASAKSQAPPTQPTGYRSAPSHASKASSSGFNVEAKEFKFEPEPKPALVKKTSMDKNPFMPASPTSSAATRPAVSLLTAHANGETTGGGNFNVTAPVFKPPEQSNFNFSSAFDFSAKKPHAQLASKEGTNKEQFARDRIFSPINPTEDIIKPMKKSKAIPIVNPNVIPQKGKEDADLQEDEEGRIAQGSERFKRSKPTMLDGQNEPKFDLPPSATGGNKLGIPTTLPKLDNMIDEKDSDFDDVDKEPWHEFGLDVAKQRPQTEVSKQEKPVNGTYVPPHKRMNTVQDIDDHDAAPQVPAVKEASASSARDASLAGQQSRSRSPPSPSRPLSPTYQEIDAIMENLNGAPEFGIEEQEQHNKLPAPVKSPVKREQPHDDSPLLRESKLSALEAVPKRQSPAVSADWIREQQQSMRNSASPVRKLVGTQDTQISDWDDMLESGDESKLVPHAQFFDTRIKSLIEGVLQQHLNPLQQSLKDVDSSVRAASTHAPLPAATERTDSDADDEGNADETRPGRRARRSQAKLEQIRSVVMDAIKPLAMGNTAIPDASEIRSMIAEELKPLSDKHHALDAREIRAIIGDELRPLSTREHDLDAKQVRAIVQSALSSSEYGRGGLDVEQMRLVVAESVKASGPPQAPAFDTERILSLIADVVKASAPTTPTMDTEQIRSLINQAVASMAPESQPLDREQMRSIVTDAVKVSSAQSAPAAEFDPEHMRLVVAETIKSFGIASSSMNPDQMRAIVTEAMKSSTPIADQFDPEHMKLVVAETIKAFGGPREPLEEQKLRGIVAEAVKANAPSPAPAFDPDEIRAIVKEVVNFSKAEDTALEPEHIRSIIMEAIASAGIKEAIASTTDASHGAATANLERIESEVRLRSDAESRYKDVEKMLELSEKEISLYKENQTHTDHHIQSLRRDKQAAQDRIENLEKAERELKVRLSGQSNQVSALEATLDEYRKTADRWREERDSVRQGREELQIVLDKLRQEVEQHRQERGEFHSKAESLQEKLAGVARNFADEREASVKKTDRIEALKEKLQFSTNSHTSDRDAFRRKDEEAVKELTVLSARLEEEMRVRQRLEGNLQVMATHERNAIKASVQLEETRHSHARLTADVQKLRDANLAAQSDINMREREAMEAKDIARSEFQRGKGLVEAELEVARRKFDGVRTELETRLHHVRQELQTVKAEAEHQRKDYGRRTEEANKARTNAVRETMENVSIARNEERARFDRHVADLSREHALAMRRALGDQQRAEVHFSEALKVKDGKLQLLDDKCKHLEDKVTVAQSAAQAAATAAQQQQTTKAQNRESLRPSDRVSPQALRESIVVLQEQLQERETRIESLEFERGGLLKARDAETKLVARETEINWLRELFGVRVDDLSDLVDMLSGEGYDHIEARDAAIRIRANLQMEQQEKERLIGQTNKAAGLPASNTAASAISQGLQEQGRDMLRDVSNFATPRAAQIAAAWGNWRRGQASPGLSTIRDAVAGPNATPSRRGMRLDSALSDATAIGSADKVAGRSASAAQTFLTGLMTPPASNYVRRTPTPTSTMQRTRYQERMPSYSTDGRELDAQPLSMSLEDELEATGDEEISPQLSPTRSRLSKPRTPQATAGVSVSEHEDPLRTPLEAEPGMFGGDDASFAHRGGDQVRSLEDELADGADGMGESQEIAQDSVLSPLGPPENLVGSS